MTSLPGFSSTGDFSGSSSSEEEEEDDTSPREKVLKSTKGQKDFRVKDIKIAPFGRKEIEMAEQGMGYGIWGMGYGVWDRYSKDIDSNPIFFLKHCLLFGGCRYYSIHVHVRAPCYIIYMYV